MSGSLQQPQHGQTVPCPETGDSDLVLGLALSLDDYVCPCTDGCPLCDPDGRNEPVTSWKPTKKFYALVAGGVASIGASWLVTGQFDDVERGMAATLLVGAVAAFFKSNDATETGDGVPQ